MSMSMTQMAARIYSEACVGAGEKPSFTRAVARLVGTTAQDKSDLTMRFRLEAEVMARAAEIAARYEDAGQ